MCFPKLFLETLTILLDRPDQVQDLYDQSLKTRDRCTRPVYGVKGINKKSGIV